MKYAEIVRVFGRPDGTFGILSVGDERTIAGFNPICLTCERPWLGNQRGISCIPTGQYTCLRVNSPKFGDTFEVTGVPQRSEILLHRGNIDDDSHGCIILGENFAPWTTGQLSIASSYNAFAEFLHEMKDQDSFSLTIREVKYNEETV